MKKTAEKTAASPELIPQPNGSAILSGGMPGNKGGGRKPDAFKARMRQLVTQADRNGHVAKVLNDPDHPQWLGALKYATEHGYGKAKETVELSGAVGSYVVEVPAKAASAAEWAGRYAKGEE